MQDVSGTAQKRSIDTIVLGRKDHRPPAKGQTDVRVKIDKTSTENYGYPVE